MGGMNTERAPRAPAAGAGFKPSSLAAPQKEATCSSQSTPSAVAGARLELPRGLHKGDPKTAPRVSQG